MLLPPVVFWGFPHPGCGPVDAAGQVREGELGQPLRRGGQEPRRRSCRFTLCLSPGFPPGAGSLVARALRAMPQGDKPKVVFCTTENDLAHIARAMHAGADEYIMKPFDKEIVEAKFQEVGLI